MRRIERTWLYMIFFAPLAFFYEPIKEFLGGGWLFVIIGVLYISICSFFAFLLGRQD